MFSTSSAHTVCTGYDMKSISHENTTEGVIHPHGDLIV